MKCMEAHNQRFNVRLENRKTSMKSNIRKMAKADHKGTCSSISTRMGTKNRCCKLVNLFYTHTNKSEGFPNEDAWNNAYHGENNAELRRQSHGRWWWLRMSWKQLEMGRIEQSASLDDIFGWWDWNGSPCKIAKALLVSLWGLLSTCFYLNAALVTKGAAY